MDDPIYRRLFAFPRMVEDLLRAVAAGDWIEMRVLIEPVADALAPCQPAQRSLLLDERRAAVDDLPLGNLMRAVVGFEQSRSPADLATVVDRLRGWLQEPGDSELGRAFTDWLLQLAARMQPGDAAELPPTATFEETRMSLLDRVAQWPEEWLEQGRREGVEQGLEQERALLRHQAGLRFGSGVAQRIEPSLARIGDVERFTVAAELIVSAPTGAELIERLAALAGPAS